MLRASAVVSLLLLASCNSTARLLGTTLIGDTFDRVGPYPVLTQVDDPDGFDQIWLYVRLGKAGEAKLPMEQVSRGVFRGLIPGQPPFTEVCYFIKVVDGEQVVTDPTAALTTDPGVCFMVLGTACTQDVECGPGERCDSSGVCRQSVGTCLVDTDCGKGFRCGPLRTCLLAKRRCQHDEGCLLGEVCDKLLAECVPRPSCSDDLQCPLGFQCHDAAGSCSRDCLGSADCGPGESCAGGVCSGAISCAASACPTDLICDPVLAICRVEGAGLCAPCQHDADCGGPNDFCLPLGAAQVCGRDCSSQPCPTGYVCGSSTVPPQCQPASGACG